MVDNRVTGKDVARAAGVTTATVSNVLNGKRNVGESTRKRVLEAVRELGYVPDRAARALRQRTSGAIGVVIEKNLTNPRYGRTVEGMLRAADANGYRITLCRNHRAEDSPCDDYLRAYFEHQVDGIIFVSRDIEGPSPESIMTVERDHVPFVALDCQTASDAFSTIDFDYRGGACEVARHLLSQGAHRVVYLRPAHRNAQESLREEGVRLGCSECGLPNGPQVVEIDVDVLIKDAGYEPGSGDGDIFAQPSQVYMRSLARELCDRAAGTVRPGDAVICSWAGWSNALSRYFSLPGVLFADLASDYLSVLGPDMFCEMPNYEAGERAVEALLALIGGSAPTAITLPLACIDLTVSLPRA